MSIHQSLFKLPRVFSNLLAKLKKNGKSYCAHFDLLTVAFSLLDRLPRGEEQRAEPRRESQVVRHRREGPGGEAGAAAAHQEVFPDIATAVTTGKIRCHLQDVCTYWTRFTCTVESTWYWLRGGHAEVRSTWG